MEWWQSKEVEGSHQHHGVLVGSLYAPSQPRPGQRRRSSGCLCCAHKTLSSRSRPWRLNKSKPRKAKSKQRRDPPHAASSATLPTGPTWPTQAGAIGCNCPFLTFSHPEKPQKGLPRLQQWWRTWTSCGRRQAAHKALLSQHSVW